MCEEHSCSHMSHLLRLRRWEKRKTGRNAFKNSFGLKDFYGLKRFHLREVQYLVLSDFFKKISLFASYRTTDLVKFLEGVSRVVKVGWGDF